MLRHICMFKLVSKDEIQNFIDKAQVLSEVPTVRRLEVVSNAKGLPESNFDVSLIIDFDDAKGLEDYLVYPKHVEFSNYVGTVKTDRACIDYEFYYV